MNKQIFSWAPAMGASAVAILLVLAIPHALSAQRVGPDTQRNEALKMTSRQSIEWWNSEFEVNPDTLFAEDCVNHQEPIAANAGEKGVTLAELKDIVTSYHGAFPATKVEIQMQLVQGNRVATHWRFTGVQKGVYESLAPTNKTVSWAGISIDEYDNHGKIKASWVVWDKFTMFSTLGLIK